MLIVLKKVKKNSLKYTKIQRRFKIERHNVFFTEEVNEIALKPNDDKRIQSVDSIETYAHGMSKDLIWQKEKINRINIIK